jgi:hypothetical protein
LRPPPSARVGQNDPSADIERIDLVTKQDGMGTVLVSKKINPLNIFSQRDGFPEAIPAFSTAC